MRVLGIDPGSNVTGYGVVEKNGAGLRHVDNGCYRVRPAASFPERLDAIFACLSDAIARFHPDAVAVEKAFFAKNPMSALKLGESRGVAVLAAARSRLPVFEYSTREVKQAVTGYGQATKGQIQQMVLRILALPEPAAEDASDALAVAICHLNSFRLKEALRRSA